MLSFFLVVSLGLMSASGPSSTPFEKISAQVCYGCGNQRVFIGTSKLYLARFTHTHPSKIQRIDGEKTWFQKNNFA